MIEPSILELFPNLNQQQKAVIDHEDGPLVVIAGPGSGKTLVLILRAINIIIRGMAQPRELILCTFTEKAAFELRDRINSTAKECGYNENLSEMKIGTIHGICNEFIQKHRHRTPLGNNYEVLDEITQLLFIFDNFSQIIGEKENEQYLKRWKTKWSAIQGASRYFNKITEELIEPKALTRDSNPFIQMIGGSYLSYEKLLFESNRIDFAHQQKLFFQLLMEEKFSNKIITDIKYVMVDEYQDTNYIQEQLILKLSSKNGNICVVGDEDQSIYRFRGATVRNILEFEKNINGCQKILLDTNYRSHSRIIEKYNKYMNSCDWSNSNSKYNFRHDKAIIPNPHVNFPDYPAIFSVWGQSYKDEANRLAELILYLKEERIVEDYSQIAFLLHSVRLKNIKHYIQAFKANNIPVYCPRSRSYFENEEIQLMLACFAIILGYYGEVRGYMGGFRQQKLSTYIDNCIKKLGSEYSSPKPIAIKVQQFVSEIEDLGKEKTIDMRLGDYFYKLLGFAPFPDFLKDETKARNLAIFSQLVNMFQNYYHYNTISGKNLEYLRLHFFNSFIQLMYDGGINEYEDPNQPFPRGQLQIMTIHQAKGLEFPVVVVGSLDKTLGSPKDIDRILSPYYHRIQFEPENRITLFDRMRLHYVAMSRAEKVLVLTTTKTPLQYFHAIWQGLPQWPYVRKDLLKALFFKLRNRIKPKQSFSFTSDLKVFETCPLQYKFFRHYDFVPSRSAEIFFGALVHHTIEDIHMVALDGKIKMLDEEKIGGFFDDNFSNLKNLGIRPIGQTQRENALKQVMNYFNQNEEGMERIVEVEVDVSTEKDEYILTGKIDLLMGIDGKIELLDFKSQPRPQEDDERIKLYYKQLCVYAHILEERYGKRPERLLLYWTGEERKADALMEFQYHPADVKEAGKHFDRVVKAILMKRFELGEPPEVKVCQECDLRTHCSRQNIIKLKEV